MSEILTPSDLENALYYGFSRTLFILSILLFMIVMFTNHCNTHKAYLSVPNTRLIARSMVVICLIQVLVIQRMYCSTEEIPLGVTLTGSSGAIYGMGNIVCSAILGIFFCVFFEGPLTRVMQYTI
jgi:hypothetical protein